MNKASPVDDNNHPTPITDSNAEPAEGNQPEADNATHRIDSEEATHEPPESAEDHPESEEVSHTEAEDSLSTLEAKLAEYENIIKRQQAEFDNYRKRTLEEKHQLITYAPGDFIKSLLPILNNYTQALAQHANESDPKIKSFLEGVSIIKQQLDEVLSAAHVKPSTEVGDLFDPNLHQALMMEPGEGTEDHVSEVFEQGYLFHERILKEAHVKVLQKKPTPNPSPKPKEETDSVSPNPDHSDDSETQGTQSNSS